MKIADIFEYKNGKKRVDFFNLGIYDLIRNNLNFRFINIDGKGYYLEQRNRVFMKSNFYEMEEAFRNYINEKFENLEINGKVTHATFLNFYYKKSPIKDNSLSRKFLSEDFKLSDNELHLLKMQTNNHYRNENIRQEMDEFISRENFIETKKLSSLLISKESKVFYKQFNSNSFFIIQYSNWNKKKIAPTYDLFKIDAKNDNELFKKTDNDDELITLKFSFNLNRDLELYNEEKNNI